MVLIFFEFADPAVGVGGTPSSAKCNIVQPFIPPGGSPERPATNPSSFPDSTPTEEVGEALHVPEAASTAPSTSSGDGLTLDDFMEAQKYAKYAVSALSYEDAKTAIESMMKALEILQKH